MEEMLDLIEFVEAIGIPGYPFSDAPEVEDELGTKPYKGCGCWKCIFGLGTEPINGE
ncbi:unnamed protein product [Schistosoma mattheei]|uniref:Uncharacterized protein n=1 Tax=Schistosoma mattheei TaxID=31246 RepID=A0A183PPS2_9TREM|nr:unnamed protein product [Schistosoma mattheei]